MRESEERFRLLVNSVSDYAIFHLDPNGVVTSWNLGAERLKGYRADEILGHHFSRFYTHEDVRAGVPAAALESALADGRWESEGWRIRKDGSRFWADVVITALRDSTRRASRLREGHPRPDGPQAQRGRTPRCPRARTRDRNEAARARSVAQRGRRVSSRTTSVRRSASSRASSIFSVSSGPSSTRADKLDYLDRIAARLTTMGDAGRRRVRHGPDRVRSARGRTRRVRRVARSWTGRSATSLADPTSRLIEVRAAPGLRALADPTRTVQVISNLLSNALKYSPPDAPITILVEQDDAGVHISVTDLGEGIPADDHERLFQPFTRLDRHHGTRGTGLGLYIAKALAEAAGRCPLAPIRARAADRPSRSRSPHRRADERTDVGRGFSSSTTTTTRCSSSGACWRGAASTM